MAKFKKGEKPKHAGGRPRLPKDLLDAKKLTSEEFMRTATELLRLPPQAICDVVNDPATPALTTLVGTMIVKAIDEGDERRCDFLLARIVGKVPDRIEVEEIPPLHFVKAKSRKETK